MESWQRHSTAQDIWGHEHRDSIAAELEEEGVKKNSSVWIGKWQGKKKEKWAQLGQDERDRYQEKAEQQRKDGLSQEEKKRCVFNTHRIITTMKYIFR